LLAGRVDPAEAHVDLAAPQRRRRGGQVAAVREYTDTQHAAHVLFGQQ
jgi:hypothetical protein